jgi:methionine-rich copper-binding protein CopC
MRNRRAVVVVSALLALAAGLMGPLRSASAHSFPSETHPAAGSTVNSPPAEVAIEFDGPVRMTSVKLQVRDSAGADETAGATVVSKDRRCLSVRLKPLKPGEFTVQWKITAQDGHASEGSFSFTVAGGDRS